MYPTSSQSMNMILGQILTNDVLDKRILTALNTIKREDFLPAHLHGCAYVDEDLDVGNGRFLLEPLTFARMLQLSEITPACRVLCVGALSGYSAAVLAWLASHIVTTEIDAEYVKQIRTNLAKLHLTNVDVQQVKSLADGYALSAPYDVILVNGAIDFVPEDLASQLAINGRLVAVHRKSLRPGSNMGLGKLLLVKRVGNQLQSREYFDCGAALLPNFERNASFKF
ncbi:MAG: protein-L-isoaspartate O-methyltransferase family protein [Alphaproteobacteria bacterium]